MSKKTLLIILVIIIFVAIDIVGYVFFFQNKSSLLKDNLSKTNSETNLFPNAETRLLETSEINSNEPKETSTTSGVLTEESLSSKQNDQQFSSFLFDPSKLTFSSLASLKLGTTTRTFLLEKTNGNFYEYLTSGNVKRLSNTTLFGIGEFFWGQEKNSLRFILRRFNNGFYANTSGTLKIPNDQEIEQVLTEVLSDNILSVVSSPNKDRVFVLVGKTGVVDGYLGDFNLNNQKKIFSSPLSEWSIPWPNDNYLIFQTKPSSEVPGYVFSLNLKTKKFEPILRNIPGLTTLAKPDLTKIVYSRSGLNNVYTYLFNLKEEKSVKLNLSTLPEKCVWSKSEEVVFCAVPKSLPKANYPDDWYQGKIQFNDSLWSINSTSGNVELISDSQSLGDLINLSYNPTLKKVFGIDRSTGKLRVVQINLGE